MARFDAMISVELWLICLGFIVHIILLYSIFDIYYISPLVQNCKAYPITSGKGLASRVVIFTADGLRADTFFQNPEKSPFLHAIMKAQKACWGLSKSHVPTESRPGHVAIFAGFYEDVSAVARGWKMNPVQFDSLFNRSRRSWSWGSPDIVPIFTKGISSAASNVYSAELEDFHSKDAGILDRWVFDNVKELFKNASDILKENLSQDRVLFFLHLLALDTIGHGYKPHSEQYINNIKTVDNGIADIVEVDIAVFISALLGNAIPTNSVGKLPYTFLDASPKYIFQAAYANLMQAGFFQFRQLQPKTLSNIETMMERLIENKRYEAAAHICMKWIPVVRSGLLYFHRYDRFLSSIAISSLFFAWILLVYSAITRNILLLLCCFALAIFPQLPVVGRYPYPGLCVFTSFLNCFFMYFISSYPRFIDNATYYQIHSFLHGITVIILIFMDYVGRKQNSLLFIQLISWLLIPCTFILPLFAPKYIVGRLISWFSAISLPYSLLSVSYESFFLFIFFILLWIYIRIQFEFSNNNNYWTNMCFSTRKDFNNCGTSKVTLMTFKQALVLITLVETAFFGTGNIASLNSFNPSSLRCFISIFSPFTMAALLIFKIFLPCFAIAIVFAFIIHMKNASVANLSCLVLIISDAMAAIFFYRLVDDGSWLEIGMSISHYVLSMAISIIIFSTLHIAKYIVFLSINDIIKKKSKHFI
ncbi:unnamed protein product [Dracunculus medinensis]|uniref:GPI ethanolamine phosphate transferase 1 n=1 Tax=Dracunculus medinensis TaxID=318479 RepID=A0A0N4UDX5_DRAME|nr:unnamed protein product [Dracunculus medinensis]